MLVTLTPYVEQHMICQNNFVLLKENQQSAQKKEDVIYLDPSIILWTSHVFILLYIQKQTKSTGWPCINLHKLNPSLCWELLGYLPVNLLSQK